MYLPCISRYRGLQRALQRAALRRGQQAALVPTAVPTDGTLATPRSSLTPSLTPGSSDARGPGSDAGRTLQQEGAVPREGRRHAADNLDQLAHWHYGGQ